MGTTRTCEMRTLSSLELMLLKLQQAEEPPEDSLPALPARPVMRARRARMKLPLTFHNSDLVRENEAVKGSCSTSTQKEAFLDSVHHQESSETDSPHDFNKAAEDEERGVLQKKGVVIIQRCFRGHQACRYYHELKMGAISLQSFVRGENARNGYQCLVKRLRAIVIIQKHTREHRKRTEQLTGIIYLQAGIRGCLARREFDKQIASQDTDNLGNKNELTKVPQIVLLDLRRKVLITEAALERKKDENASLKKRIAEFETKWKQYEARMQSMEKMWQDQLTSIQTSLAAVRKRQAAAGNGSPRLPETSSGRLAFKPSCMLKDAGHQVNGGLDSPCHNAQFRTTLDNHPESSSWIQSGQEVSSFSAKEDLAKLKQRFKSWKKDYKTRLKEAKSTMKKLGQPDRVVGSKIWCGR
ncbi:PREDICTED: myosin-3-like [Ipomoea nil]|uniref:myosin-3-like n=1 Tax=Ipomoea nil TaxID=35883 RepID=UPI000901B5BD|nr:PREDICTED: myosin-3-like [Ipomoea nil]